MPDGARTFPALPFGAVLYAIVSNTRYSDRLSDTLRVADLPVSPIGHKDRPRA